MDEGGGEVAEKEVNVASTSSLLLSSRPRQAVTFSRQQQDLPRALDPVPTKLRILRGCRGVNKTHWSLIPTKKEGEREDQRQGGAATTTARLTPLVLFFGGDSIDAKDAHEDVMRLQTPQSQAAACFVRFGRRSVEGEEVDGDAEQKKESIEGDGTRRSSPQVVVVVPSRHEAGWACFDHFLNGLTRSGEPAPPGYAALPGLPALSQAATMLRDGGWPLLLGSSSARDFLDDDGSTMDLEELKRRKEGALFGGIGGEGIDRSSSSRTPTPWPPTKVVAFSKGGVVANQLLFELSALGHAGMRRRSGRGSERGTGKGRTRETERWERNVAAVEKLLSPAAAGAAVAVPPSFETLLSATAPRSLGLTAPSPPAARSLLAPLVASLASSIDSVSLVDAGLNCRGAYALTDPNAARGIALLDDEDEDDEVEQEEAKEGEGGRRRLRVELVGTPRQWSDRSRPFLQQERDRMFSCLEDAGVSTELRWVLERRKGDLRTHFLSIEAFAELGEGDGGC